MDAGVLFVARGRVWLVIIEVPRCMPERHGCWPINIPSRSGLECIRSSVTRLNPIKGLLDIAKGRYPPVEAVPPVTSRRNGLLSVNRHEEPGNCNVPHYRKCHFCIFGFCSYQNRPARHDSVAYVAVEGVIKQYLNTRR